MRENSLPKACYQMVSALGTDQSSTSTNLVSSWSA